MIGGLTGDPSDAELTAGLVGSVVAFEGANLIPTEALDEGKADGVIAGGNGICARHGSANKAVKANDERPTRAQPRAARRSFFKLRFGMTATFKKRGYASLVRIHRDRWALEQCANSSRKVSETQLG